MKRRYFGERKFEIFVERHASSCRLRGDGFRPRQQFSRKGRRTPRDRK
jgi:hypothetical protein